MEEWDGLGIDVLERRKIDSLRRLRSKEVEATESEPATYLMTLVLL